MRRLSGVGAAPGVAIAAPWRYVPPSPGAGDELDLRASAALAATELDQLADRLRTAGRPDEAGILEAQALMAQDPALMDAAALRIDGGASVTEAILAAGADAAETLEALDDEILSARAADVRDVAERIARVARGEAPPRLEHRAVAVAVDLPPSVTAELDASLLAGIALEAGSPTAHAAILSRALGIPAVVGVGGLLAAVGAGSEVAIDGTSGTVIVDPDPDAVRRLEAAAASYRQGVEADAALRGEPLQTRDGHRLILAANIGRPEEASPAFEAGAEAIGLFRTEFMFMGRATAPDEAAQRRAYASVLRAAAGRPVIVRLLDVGGDKHLPYLATEAEDNPFLGVRAIRLAQRQPDLLVTQLRAIIGAARATDAEAWIMAPMVADVADARLVRDLLASAGDVAMAPVKLCAMIELPSAVVVADQLAAEVDVFSIGTNDLTQYLLAADRTNPALASRQDPLHPAVLRSVRGVVEAARPRGVLVAVCGEMAGDPAGAVALAGLGVGELSMEPRSFGRVKRALRSLSLHEARELASAACDARSAAEARQIVDEALAAQPS